MKKIKSIFKASKFLPILLTLAIAGFTPEQLTGQQELDKNALIDQMATDSNYVAFLRASDESARMIAANEFDLKAINQVLDEQNITQSLCDIDEKIMLPAKGGADWIRIHCQISRSLKAFKQTYPQYNQLFTPEDRKLLILKSKMMNGMDVTGREIGDILIKTGKKH